MRDYLHALVSVLSSKGIEDQWDKTMFDKIWKTEASKASIIILLTWLVIMPMIIVKVFSEFALLALLVFGLVILQMLISIWYSRKTRMFEGLSLDERTEKFAVKSMRNGFLMAVALTTFLTIITWFGSHIGALDLLIWIWLWTSGTYMLSLLYYIWKG